MDYSSISLLEPWEEFMPGQALAFTRELRAELAPGHPLHGAELTGLAHSGASDNALFQLDDGRVVDVHLTFSGHAEPLPYPRHRTFASFQDWVQQVMIPKNREYNDA